MFCGVVDRHRRQHQAVNPEVERFDDLGSDRAEPNHRYALTGLRSL